MVEIIPNWHPLVVHFTVALWVISFVFYLLATFSRNESNKQQWTIVARWNLWTGFIITILTVAAGWYAYNTVNHDTASHAAMTVHRNWALITTSIYFLLTVWSYRNSRKHKDEGKFFIVIMLLATALLSSTAWRGGELVYRFGMGVMSLPNGNGGHDHTAHGEGDSGHHTTVTSETDANGHTDHMDVESGHGHEVQEPHGHGDSIDNHSVQIEHKH